VSRVRIDRRQHTVGGRTALTLAFVSPYRSSTGRTAAATAAVVGVTATPLLLSVRCGSQYERRRKYRHRHDLCQSARGLRSSAISAMSFADAPPVSACRSTSTASSSASESRKSGSPVSCRCASVTVSPRPRPGVHNRAFAFLEKRESRSGKSDLVGGVEERFTPSWNKIFAADSPPGPSVASRRSVEGAGQRLESPTSVNPCWLFGHETHSLAAGSPVRQ
jgi:hypothetical protein